MQRAHLPAQWHHSGLDNRAPAACAVRRDLCADACSLPKYYFKTTDDSKLEARRLQLVDFWDNLTRWVSHPMLKNVTPPHGLQSIMESQPMRDLLQHAEKRQPEQAATWARALSHDKLTFGDGGTIATKVSWDPLYPAACVAVPRGAAGGFVLAAVVVVMPSEDDQFGFGAFTFGVGRAIPKEEGRFGSSCGNSGTCGLAQECYELSNPDWVASTNDFGRRADRDDYKFSTTTSPSHYGNTPASAIKEGSRLALYLSPLGIESTRTAHFFVDGSEVAVFADIEDDGGSSNWVAGFTLGSGCASVRLVPAEGAELAPRKARPNPNGLID
jgi:hypothetical protein